MSLEDANEITVRRFWEEVWSQRKSSGSLDELTTEDFRMHYGPLTMNREALRRYLLILEVMPPSVTLEIDELLPMGETVAVRGHWVNAPPRDWSKIMPGLARARYESTGMALHDQNFSLAFVHVADGKISTLWIAGIYEAQSLRRPEWLKARDRAERAHRPPDERKKSGHRRRKQRRQ